MAEIVQSGCVFFGRSEGAQLGYAISVAGDVDGDGWADLILGAPGASVRDAGGVLVSASVGEAVLLRGGPGGFAPALRLATAAGDPRVTVFEGSQAHGRVGAAVAGGGDIDGDGFGDLLIGAPFRDHGAGVDAGSAFAVFGGAAALEGWSSGAPGTGSVSQEMNGGTLRSYAGFSVAMVGDIDGDGRADSAIGLPGASVGTRFGAGVVELRLGGSGDRDLDTGGGGLRIIGGAALDAAGAALSSAGDFNGDGIDDLLIGAPEANGAAAQSGAAYIVFGRDGGWQADIDLGTLAAGDGVVLRGAVSGDLAGVSVAAAGDVNGDGIDDVIIGAPEAANGRGSAYVVFGRRDGLAAAIDLGALDGAAGFRIDGAADGGDLGTSVAGVGDVNGDGFDDLLVGIPRAPAPGRIAPGGALLLFGSESGPGAVVSADSVAPGQGYLFLGAGSFDAAGITVAAAGDINGDGWNDLLIGADLANDGARVDTGAVYLVHGGPGILAALDALDGTIDGRIELARVSTAVSVESALVTAPVAAASPPPPEEVDNDPATTPELRGPHEMIAANEILTAEQRALMASKPSAGDDIAEPADSRAAGLRARLADHFDFGDPSAGPWSAPGGDAASPGLAARDPGTGGPWALFASSPGDGPAYEAPWQIMPDAGLEGFDFA
ncbi:FG-GAP repeat protein [Limibaculum sp. M0105]|uniref:FG-GAP repeat protein n=1 Tax=Thermohalobaculum xanthum TaxID=2753746 RepID=A0A8J7MA95_9RHOB|nr:integrin alpha [Thermohalobaculum xanthum]MBK0401093.1 FG-GAP repeat protein [Thermohalobaculum xanthum]